MKDNAQRLFLIETAKLSKNEKAMFYGICVLLSILVPLVYYSVV